MGPDLFRDLDKALAFVGAVIFIAGGFVGFVIGLVVFG